MKPLILITALILVGCDSPLIVEDRPELAPTPDRVYTDYNTGIAGMWCVATGTFEGHCMDITEYTIDGITDTCVAGSLRADGWGRPFTYVLQNGALTIDMRGTLITYHRSITP